jgi:hypothetical protein
MATRKPAVPTDEKFENTDLDIFKVLEALDKKDYGFYGRLTEEQQKKFVPYIITHWMSAVSATGVLGAYYTMSTDVNANRHLFNERIMQHPELQWLMLCAASPGMGKQFHKWLPHLNDKISELKIDATKKDVKDYFQKIYPSASDTDLNSVSEEFVKNQRHKRKISKMYPEMKLQDIETLSNLITEKDLDDYEKESGN